MTAKKQLKRILKLKPLAAVSIIGMITLSLLLFNDSTLFAESRKTDSKAHSMDSIITSKAGIRTMPHSTTPDNNTPSPSPKSDPIQNQSSSKSSSSLQSDTSLSKNYLEPLLEAELALSRGDLKVALRNYIWVAQETQDPKIGRRATEIALSYGDLTQAQNAAHIWAASDPNNLEAKLTLAAILIRAGDTKGALVYFKQIDMLNPNEATSQWLMLYKQLDDPNDRARISSVLEQIHTKSADAALSQIYLFNSDLQKAIQYSEKAIKLDPNNAQAIIAYAQTLASNNQLAQAIQFMEEKLKKDPKSIPLKLFFVQFCYENDQSKKAYPQVIELTKIEGLGAPELFGLARFSMEAQWFAQARIFLNKLAKLPEQSDLAYYFLARLSDVEAKPQEAIQWYLQVENPPFYMLAHIRASLIYSTILNNPDKALQTLEQAQSNNSEEAKQLALAKIEIFSSIKRYNEARHLVKMLVQENKSDLDLLFIDAILAARLKDNQAAEQSFQSILKQDPNHINALNGLGFILADTSTRYQESNELLSRALKLSPNNPSVLDSLGWLQLKMGNTQQAVSLLRQAFALLPNPEIAAHLGEALWLNNQQEEAKQLWNAALKVHPNQETVLEIMNRNMKNNAQTNTIQKKASQNKTSKN